MSVGHSPLRVNSFIQSEPNSRVWYHRISLSIIAVIAVFGLIIPFGTVAYCDSIQVFDSSCFRFGGDPLGAFKLAGAEIYYDHLIYYMNPYLVEKPYAGSDVFKLSGEPPREFLNQIILKYDDEHSGVQPSPRSLLINLKYNSTVTIFNDSKLNYDVLLRAYSDTQLLGALDADGFWSREFTNVGLYTYRLEPAGEHDNRGFSVRIFVIDEPLKDIPKSIRHNIACRLLQIDYREYPFVSGISCGGSTGPITIDFHKSMRGASPEFKQEFLDKISQNAGFLEPEISFKYGNSGNYWSIPFPLMALLEASTLK